LGIEKWLSAIELPSARCDSLSAERAKANRWWQKGIDWVQLAAIGGSRSSISYGRNQQQPII
jgi:hypothetical protein